MPTFEEKKKQELEEMKQGKPAKRGSKSASSELHCKAPPEVLSGIISGTGSVRLRSRMTRIAVSGLSHFLSTMHRAAVFLLWRSFRSLWELVRKPSGIGKCGGLRAANVQN